MLITKTFAFIMSLQLQMNRNCFTAQHTFGRKQLL